MAKGQHLKPEQIVTFIDKLLDGEIFYSLREAQIIVGEWAKQMTKGNLFRDNHVRPHSALGYRPPAPQTQVPPNNTKSTHVAAMICYRINLFSRGPKLTAVQFLMAAPLKKSKLA